MLTNPFSKGNARSDPGQPDAAEALLVDQCVKLLHAGAVAPPSERTSTRHCPISPGRSGSMSPTRTISSTSGRGIGLNQDQCALLGAVVNAPACLPFDCGDSMWKIDCIEIVHHLRVMLAAPPF
jgi:hypothetical protein